MNQLNRSKWHRRSRIGVDFSIKQFDQKIRFLNKMRNTTSDWSVCFFINREEQIANLRSLSVRGPNGTTSGGGFITQIQADKIEIAKLGGDNVNIDNVFPNTWNHIALTYNYSTKLMSIYLNGWLQKTYTFSSPIELDSILFTLFDNQGGNRVVRQEITHFCQINRQLTAKEVRYIAVNGGVLPSSTHPDVLSHITNNKVITKVIKGRSLVQSGGSTWGNNYFNSVETIPANTDGYFEFRITNIDQAGAGVNIGVPLASSPLGSTMYGWQFNGSELSLRFGGTLIGTYEFHEPGFDVYKIERVGSVLNLYVGEILYYSGAIDAAQPLYFSGGSGRPNDGREFNVANCNHNGTPITFDVGNSLNYSDDGLSDDFNLKQSIDVVEQYNYAKPSGSITAVADAGGGDIRISASAHGFVVGQQVTISDTTSYDGVYNITNINDVNTFDVTATFVATETGSYSGALTANHGVLVNYTDDELGLNGEDLQTSIKDFYNKYSAQKTFVNILKGSAINQKALSSSVAIGADFCWFFEITLHKVIQLSGNVILQLYSDTPSTTVVCEALINLSELQIKHLNNISHSIPIQTLTVNTDVKTFKIYALRYFDGVDYRIEVWLNGIKRIDTIDNSSFTGYGLRYLRVSPSGTIKENILHRLHIFNRKLLDSERDLLFDSDKEKVGGSNVIEEVIFSKNGQIGDSGITWNLSDLDNKLLEPESAMPPRKKALTFNGSSQYLRIPNFNPTKELGYTFVIHAQKLTDSDWGTPQSDYLFSKYVATANRLEIYGRAGGYKDLILGNDSESDTFELANNIKLNNLNLYTVRIKEGETTASINGLNNKTETLTSALRDLSDIANDATIGRRTSGYFTGYIGFVMITKGLLSNKEILELVNNTLLKNPSIELQNKHSLELFIDFNNPFDDGGTLKFPDLSPNGHDVIAEGYTDLADLQANLVDIDSLR